MKVSKIGSIASLLAMSLLLGACTMASTVRMAPHSHFVYPNSNVTALGPVSSKIRGNIGLAPQGMRTAELDRRLYQKALSQYQDADLIIDYIVTAELKMIYLMYIQLYYTEYELQGTAARAEVGTQELL